MADWKQLLTTGDVGALHTDASVYGHLFELPADLDTYTFDGNEGFGDVFKDTGSFTGGIGNVYYKNGSSWVFVTITMNRYRIAIGIGIHE